MPCSFSKCSSCHGSGTERGACRNREKTMSKRIVLALAWMLAAPLAAQAQAPQKLTLTLNFLAGGPQAGFMYAQSLGLYKAVGIDLTIQEGKGSATTTQMLATGQTDVGFADAPSAMQLAAQGAPVEIIAPILQT